MGKNYDQLDIDERYEIYRLHQANTSLQAIGRLMGRSPSTVSRELRRNAPPRGEYNPGSADRIALSRCRRLSRIERLNPLRTQVGDGLAMGWSPEQITSRLRLKGSEHSVSVETIYRFIYHPRVRSEKLYRFLPRAKASRGRRYFKRRREPIEGRSSISERPQSVALREEFGHWEGDLMQFRTQRGNLLTVCERKSRFILTFPLQTKTADETGEAVIKLLRNLPRAARKSITYDNGGEFARHADMEAALNMPVYFCDPHSPWQRGSIENANGILRRDLPRKTNITNYTVRDISEITWAINSTSRKCLGFKTPAEAFLQSLQCCT
ncbi:MAG: IS30 family transposase [Rhodospirillaceae bacterium]|nr:IS30 family transposase [Rhodospirillaceae bacterium]